MTADNIKTPKGKGVRKIVVGHVAALLGFACTLISCSGSGGKEASNSSGLDLPAQILKDLRERNPGIARVQVLAVSNIPWSTSRLAGIARGGTGQAFRGSLEDELFCVFVTDSTLTQVIKVVKVLPTPRWSDYSMHFERLNTDSLIVVGEAISGNAEQTKWSYDWLE